MMSNRPPRAKSYKRQGGYALLIVVFLTTLVLVGTMTIGLRVLTEGRREKEQDMIWRGKQYTRGIKLYYQKFGRFPTSLDDLTKPSNGNIRFMRQAYKDPMNQEDGSWRLIYVGPAGQLIGSLNPAVSNAQMPGGIGQPAVAGASPAGFGSLPAAAGAGFLGAGSSTPGGFGATGPGTFSPGATGAGANAAGTTSNGCPAPGAVTSGNGPGTGSGTGAGTEPGIGIPAGAGTGTATGAGTSAAATDCQNVPTGDTPTIMGGSIIGVGSKVNKSSIMVFEKAQNYHLFEFIWNPSQEMGVISSPAPPIGTPGGAPGIGQNPTGSQPNPMPPLSNPPTPNPNPQQP